MPLNYEHLVRSHTYLLQGANYYRVNYDDSTWLSLADVLASSHASVHPSSRAQLLSDALALAREGTLGYDAALAQTEYLDREWEYVPWAAAAGAMDYVSLMLRGAGEAEDDVDEYVVGKAEHLYLQLGYDARENDTYQVRRAAELPSGIRESLCGPSKIVRFERFRCHLLS